MFRKFVKKIAKRNNFGPFLKFSPLGGGGLDIEEFCDSMKKLMGNKVEESELEKIFMKVDTNCDGTVDWDEYLSYMLLEYQGQSLK